MQRNAAWRLALPALCGVLAWLAVACDGSINVSGVVYEAAELTSGHSAVFMDVPAPPAMVGAPVPNARVALFFGGDYAKKPVDESTVWKESALTDVDGRFSIGRVCNPAKFHAYIRVEAEGFLSAVKVFPHNERVSGKVKYTHDAVVIMRRRPD
jgi:hypothetical protein